MALERILNKLMSVDTVDALAGFGYVGAGAVTLLPDTSLTFLGNNMGEYALLVSLVAVAIAYVTNQPDLSFETVEEQVYTVFAALSVLIPVGYEYSTTVADAINGTAEYGYILFALSFGAYFIVAGLQNP